MSGQVREAHVRDQNGDCWAMLWFSRDGWGKDADKLDDQERTRLRPQCFDWLRADLELHRKRIEGAKVDECKAANQTLRHWQDNLDFAALRDKDALAETTRRRAGKSGNGSGRRWRCWSRRPE